MAPGAKLVAIRAGNDVGLTTYAIVQAMDYTLVNQYRYNIRVCNNSWGTTLADNPYDPNDPINTATRMMHDRNITVVFAAGNDGHDRPVWPAAMRQVIGVGAVKDGHRCDFSNFGEWVTAWSRGEDLLSTFLRWPPGPPPQTGDLEPGPLDPPADKIRGKRFEGWAIWSGTSFAAARVSGAIAAQLKRDGRSAGQVVFDMLTNTPFEGGGLIEP